MLRRRARATWRWYQDLLPIHSIRYSETVRCSFSWRALSACQRKAVDAATL